MQRMVIAKLFLKSGFRTQRYRANLSEHGWTEEQIRQHYALALEDHSHEATFAEGDDGRRNGTLFEMKKENKVR